MVWRHEHYRCLFCRVGQRSSHLQPSSSVSDALWMLMSILVICVCVLISVNELNATSAHKVSHQQHKLWTVEIKEVRTFRTRSREKLAALKGENKCVCVCVCVCAQPPHTLFSADLSSRILVTFTSAASRSRYNPVALCVWAPRRACDRFLFQSKTIGSSGLPANS